MGAGRPTGQRTTRPRLAGHVDLGYSVKREGRPPSYRALAALRWPDIPALIVICLRLTVPLTILRWPLAGGLLSMLVDAVDVVLVDAIAGMFGQPG